MTDRRHFYFSLGPVQEFVGKARRLRDYWTGSFLLSYLTEQAMDEVCKNGGEIVFPPYDENEPSQNPQRHEIGSFPNKFQALVPSNFKPTCCEERIKATWKTIADYVWTNYISEIAPLGRGTREIWDRQMEGFWYMQWVLSEEENDALLDIRKNWRSHVPTIEPGDKCTLFGNMQELSGYIRSSKRGEREKQEKFWKEMRSKLPFLDLKEGERLSAIALIKRLFPRVSNRLMGHSLPENFPSTTYMSGVMWKAAVLKHEKEKAIDFVKEARRLKNPSSEAKAGIRCLEDLACNDELLKDFISLDGNCFYSHTLLNDNLWPYDDRSIRDSLARKLRKISEDIGFLPDTYFALLSMDGDKMGALLQENKDIKSKISEKISDFSQRVPAIVEEHQGRTIYAGGEDVFAILPVDTAIDAAVKLKTEYSDLFKQIPDLKQEATISAAIIFAHHHAPLNQLYEKIQSLLDKKAKEECGRSSIAICTWNTGGPDLVWAMPWDKLIKDTGKNLITKLAKAFGKTKDAQNISNSFTYNLRRNFRLFLSEDGSAFISDEDFLKLLNAEYRKSRSREIDLMQHKDESQPPMEDLLEICSLYYRDEAGEIKKRKGFNIDGVLIVKFLARRWQHDRD